MDYRAGNAITVQDLHPLPPIEDLLNSIFSFCWFTQFYCAAGYHWIHSATADWNKWTTTTTLGLYKWRVRQFALAKVPSQFMHMTTSILVRMTRIVTGMYLNEIIFHSHTLAEHVVHVHIMLTLPTEYGLKAKHPQCGWPWQKVNFCSFDIDKNCIHAQEHETHVVMDWPPPENNENVTGFLGFTIYYRKSIWTLCSHCNAVVCNWHPFKGKWGSWATMLRAKEDQAHSIYME